MSVSGYYEHLKVFASLQRFKSFSFLYDVKFVNTQLILKYMFFCSTCCFHVFRLELDNGCHFGHYNIVVDSCFC